MRMQVSVVVLVAVLLSGMAVGGIVAASVVPGGGAACGSGVIQVALPGGCGIAVGYVRPDAPMFHRVDGEACGGGVERGGK